MIFKKPGPENTDGALWFALQKAHELEGINCIIVASITGATAGKLWELVKKGNNKVEVVVVTVPHSLGSEAKESWHTDLEAQGMKICRGTTIFADADQAREDQNHDSAMSLIAKTFRSMGEGVKVCVEIAVAAADAGLVPHGKDVIAVAGTDQGADTVVLLTAEPRDQLFSIKIREILAKPRDWVSRAEREEKQASARH